MWSIQPLGPAGSRWRYLEETNVLETLFRTPDGTVVLTDFMPAVSEEAKRRLLLPEHELIRRLECTEGTVEMRIRFIPRPDYRRVRDAVRNAGPFGFRIERGASIVTLRSEQPLRLDASGGVSGVVRLRAGETAALSLSYAADGPAVLPPLGPLVPEKLARSAAFESRGRATWWLGALIGLGHAGFVLSVAMSFLPAMHPRMANERQGPTMVRQLEPPGFLALHYGIRTPLAVAIAHVVFGAILGAFYPLA